ncbi:hypothetical protein M378DRAFT_102403 [Amanita muscaria Koide BX008]|uniref:Nephrocystin 3-like N-terminal domain-containing protein n=1 Tax=Amanita muscaria (strain Koide BX008) TaxID=946122 RepID=A0A0C2XEJ1_AMAMK|nr:hypothetical protein M378DRAFT_102403 [Amanita muscaria Koide BX008]
MLSSAFGASPAQLLQSGNNSGIIGDSANSWNISNITPLEDEEAQLDGLLDGYISDDAIHNYSSPECYPDTRTTVRNEIGWRVDESRFQKSPLLWLNGPAGVGKSVIAKTISEFHDKVVATFFFSTSSDRSATMLLPTLARQLARSIPDTRKYIIASLNHNPLLLMSEVEEQFDHLILQPLKSITTLESCRPGISRPVMVIDGVNECTNERMLGRFLRALVHAGKRGMPVRFLICSQQEPWIRAILGTDDVNTTANEQELRFPSLLERVSYFVRSPFPEYPSRTDLHTPIQRSRGFTKFLQDVWELYRPIIIGVNIPSPSDTSDEHSDTLDKICHHRVISSIQIGFSEECKNDIARYLTDKFKAIYPGDGTNPWFRPSDISNLVEVSCGQFLYASTIVRLLEYPNYHSNYHSEDILDMARRTSLPTPDFDNMYKAILERAMRERLDSQTEWRFVMDSLAILVFFAGNAHFFTVPKSFPVIESLLGLKRGELTTKLSMMHSVLKIVPGESVQVHHRSFLEYLQDQKRSGKYYISYSAAIRRVLILMVRTGLRYNIFQDNDSGRLYIQDMIVAYHGNFFGRSRFSNVLILLHYLIHLRMRESLILVFDRHIPLALSVPPVCRLIIRFLLGFLGTFIISLTTYLLFLGLSINIPFFDPFLHPFFVATGGFFVPSRLLFILLVSLTLILLVE